MTIALSEKEMEVIEKLKLVDISKAEGRVLFYLLNAGKKSLARDIEVSVDLRQPEVSIATKKLIDRGWINAAPFRKNAGKGRPLFLYSFAMQKRDIFRSINKMFSEKIKVMEKERDTFNALIESMKEEQVKS